MPIKLCIHGVAGRMGRRLAFLVAEDADLSVVAATEYPGHPWIGRDLGEQLGLGASGVPVRDGLDFPAETDAIIDFSFAEVAVKHGQAAAVRGLPFVLGTTGLTVEQKKEVDALADRLPLLHAANFSVGVAVLCKAAAMVAETLGGEYQVEIVEAHHDQKADAPSGTALRLAEVISAALARDLKKNAVYGRHGRTGARDKTEIGVHAVRLADIVGEHTVYFGIGGERLELTHKASSRDTFARGALRAAKWLVQNKKGPGRYTMEQVLGLA